MVKKFKITQNQPLRDAAGRAGANFVVCKEIRTDMKKLILASLITLSFNASAQVFDLVRSVVVHQSTLTGNMTSDDTESIGYTQKGTMEINGADIIRTFDTCVFGSCGHYVFRDKIIGSTDTVAMIGGDSGDMVSVKIISLAPTIIIMQIDEKIVRLEEYKPR